MHLEAEKIAKWISSDEITVSEEADVFKIILDWVNHRKSERKTEFEELFGHVRLGFLSRDCLEDVVTNELLRENSACVKLVLDATVQMATFVDEDDFLQSPRGCLDTRVIVARGGKHTFCYIPEEDLWKRLPDGLKDIDANLTQMIKFRDQLFTFTNNQNSERYDPVFNVWSELNLSTNSAKLAVLKGEIYAVEFDTKNRTTATKRYNVKQYEWETLDSYHRECRQGACVIAAGSHLYAFGGENLRFSNNGTAERFDTVENEWERIADMLEERSDAFGVASQEKIFVAGGNGFRGRLETCEMYNTLTNEWQLVANLNFPRRYGSIVCLDGKLYVLGGESHYIRSVECFDSANDKWIQETTIPVKNIDPENNDTFSGCVLKLSKELLDKLMIVEQ